VSIGIILGVPGVRDAMRGTRAPVVGVSPLVGGRPVRGHADVCLKTIGVDTTSEAIAGLYQDFLDGWLVDSEDAMARSGTRSGLALVARPLLMSSIAAAAEIAGAALDLALRVAGAPDEAEPQP
jgi:LPPG:FO 2-phospho-L-lactate transferase